MKDPLSSWEEAILNVLISRRNIEQPLWPKESIVSSENLLESTSDHDIANLQRKFLRRLIMFYDKHNLSLRLNRKSLLKGEELVMNKSVVKGNADMKKISKNSMVRFDIVEAIYKTPDKWKEGSIKKLIVMPRSADIDTILKQAKDKLRMKKKAVRCFYQDRDIELELTHNLEGLEDGATLYVTSQKLVQKNEDTSDQNINESVIPDPLEMVKLVYKKLSGELSRKQRQLLLPNEYPFPTELPTLPSFRNDLPISSSRINILTTIARSRVTVICGATGCGKSTQVPQYIYEYMQIENIDGNIIVTQPRRVAATSLANRVAMERDEKVGAVVGYQIRLDSKISKQTRITFMTIGILLRKLLFSLGTQEIPLSDISHLLIDEIHERDVDTDFCLTILRLVLQRNPNLKLVLMSATNTPGLFVRYFQSEALNIYPEVLDVPRRAFPVTTIWLDTIENLIGRKISDWSEDIHYDTRDSNKESRSVLFSPKATAPIDDVFVSKLIQHLIVSSQTSEAILVFLPGRAEIESMARSLRREDDEENPILDIHFLYSSVSPSKQLKAFRPSEQGKTKVVLATNLAETSITIPDISIVIDTGRIKECRFNAEKRMKELVTVWTSQASALQRAGRAGRTRPGLCYCLYTESFANTHMLKQSLPEILRIPLDELILQSCLLEENLLDWRALNQGTKRLQEGTAPIEFLQKTPEPPPDESLLMACEELYRMGALIRISGESDSIRVKMTPLGYHLAHLPMDVKIGKILIVGCILGCLDPALTLAAALSNTKSIFFGKINNQQKFLVENGFGGMSWPGGTVKGDSIAVIAAYNAWRENTMETTRFQFAMENGLSPIALIEVDNLRKQYQSCLLDAGFLKSDIHDNSNSQAHDALLTSCCLVAGLYPNVARLLRPNNPRGKLGFRGGRLITQNLDSCLPSLESFQAERVQKASENGPDIFAVYLSKLQIVGSSSTSDGKGNLTKKPFLCNVNFVSSFALLLFGGELEVKDNNYLTLDQWIKLKFGPHGRLSGILVAELRRELDMVLLNRLSGNHDDGQDVIQVIRKILDRP
jgi:ATP-dependent RNA helicase DHX57